MTMDLWPARTTALALRQINNPNAKSKGGDTQTGYVLALHMNLVPEKLRAAAQKAGGQDRSQPRAAGHGLSGHALSAGRT
jgi:hypothetical protein